MEIAVDTSERQISNIRLYAVPLEMGPVRHHSLDVIQHIWTTSPHNNFLIPSIHCPRPVNVALKLSNNTFQ